MLVHFNLKFSDNNVKKKKKNLRFMLIVHVAKVKVL